LPYTAQHRANGGSRQAARAVVGGSRAKFVAGEGRSSTKHLRFSAAFETLSE
jgi:hypothetical protein